MPKLEYPHRLQVFRDSYASSIAIYKPVLSDPLLSLCRKCPTSVLAAVYPVVVLNKKCPHVNKLNIAAKGSCDILFTLAVD